MACLAVALAACLWATGQYAAASVDHGEAARRLAAAKGIRGEPMKGPAPLKLSRQTIDAANEVIEQMNLPWPDLFAAFEGGLPPTVALLALEPDIRKQMFRILAEAQSLEDMVDFAKYIDSRGRFDEVVLVKHEVAEDDPSRPVRFVLQAYWGE